MPVCVLRPGCGCKLFVTSLSGATGAWFAVSSWQKAEATALVPASVYRLVGARA